LGEPVDGLLGEHRLAVKLDFEVAGVADLDFGFQAELFLETVREGDRPRTIPSHPAIVDLNFHEYPPEP